MALTPSTPVSGASNTNFANKAVADHPVAAQLAPQEMSAAIASGNQASVDGVAATTTFQPVAQAVSDHQQMYNSKSWWQSIIGDVTHVAGAAVQGISKVPVLGNLLTWANKPLQELQKDYKFVHALYANGDIASGLLATLGVAAGGLVGSLAGPEGAVIGTDLAAAATRNLMGRLIPNAQNAYNKSNDPNYQVSFGRDFSNGLSNVPGFGFLKDTNHGVGQFVSGVADAAFDINLDPLAKAGKIAGNLKTGKYVDYATDADGKPLLNAEGKPIQISTLKFAKAGGAVDRFIQQASGKAYDSSAIQAAYDAPGMINNGFKRAVDDIASKSNPIDIQKSYPASEFTNDIAKQLSEANTGQEVVNVLGKSLYAMETTESALKAGSGALILPSRTLARSFAGKAMDKIIQKAGDTNIAEERNLLLPKSAPVLDEAGKPVMLTDSEGNQYQKTQILGGGLYTKTDGQSNAWNALANKIRTFTGYRSLAIDPKLLEQSGKSFKFNDIGAGTALYNMAYYAMPRDVALEKASQIIFEADPKVQQDLYGQLVKEVVKAAGLPNNSAIVDHTMSMAQRVTAENGNTFGVMGHDVKGSARGQVEMKQDPVTGKAPVDPAAVALWSWQRGSNAFIDFKELRRAMRQASMHGAMYQKADDFFTYYTDKIFAPLTLFTSGFGMRVASSEALHQVIRSGLGDYIQNKVAMAAAKHNYIRNMSPDLIGKFADQAAMALTSEDHDALVSKSLVTDNAVTRMIAQKAETYAALDKAGKIDALKNDIGALQNRIRPIGFVASKIAPYVAAEKLDVITRWQQLMGGQTLPAGIASDHFAHYNINAPERVDKLVQTHGRGGTPGADITSLTGTDEHYHMFWALNLSKMRNEQMAKDIYNDYFKLKQTDPNWANYTNDQKWARVQDLHQARLEDVKQYADLRPTMVGLRDGEPASMADEQVNSLRGLVEARSGVVHENLMQNVIKGKQTLESEVKAIPLTDKVEKVIGKTPRATIDNPLQRALQMGYRTFINPVIDHVSREPMFGHYLFENYRDLKPLIGKGPGKISEEEALQYAGQKAVVNMLPLIHNPELRSQFGMLSRNLLPFYFAQEQAIKRVGRLTYTNPQAFRDFQMINHGINNPGFVHTDANGNKYIVYPLVGEFGNAALRGLQALGINSFSGLPMSVTGSTSSLLTVLPDLKVPNVGPMANFAITAFANHFPWSDKIVNTITGGYPAKGWIDTVMPNSSVRDIFNGLTMNEKETSVHNAILSAIAAGYYHGDIPDNFGALPPQQQQAIMDRIDSNAKSNLFIKGLFSFFLPLSPTVSNDYYNKDLQTLRSEFLNMQKQVNPDTGANYTMAEATAKFLADHGTKDNPYRAISYTVAHTTSGSGGATVPLSDATMSWLSQNKDLINGPNAAGAAYLIPQNTSSADALQVEQKLLAMHLRSQATPAQFLNSVYVSKGWNDLGQDFKDYQSYMKSAREAGNKFGMGQATSIWNNIAQQYGMSNPIWYSDFTSTARLTSADIALKDLQALQGNGKIAGPQAAGIQELLASYKDYHSALQANMVNGRKNSLYSSIQDSWYNYLDQVLGSDKNLTNVVNSVFRRVK